MEKRTVLITGCSSGIGLALAEEFSRQGYKVLATARKVDSINHLKGDSIEIGSLDVTNAESIRECIGRFMKTNDRIDVLVNNAGFALFGPMAEIPIREVRRQFETNCIGAVAMVQSVLPYMPKKTGSKIVNIGSISGILTTPFAGCYCATKSAIHSLSDAMRMELAPFGIQVATVQPGSIRSSFSDKSSKDMDSYRDAKSMYHKVADSIVSRAYESQQNPTKAEDLARSLVRLIGKKHTPAVIRLGNMSFKVPFLAAILPRPVIDMILTKRSRLQRLGTT